MKNVINKRRSIRKFLDKPIKESKIKQIINAGIQAPSACNLQAWRFVILTENEKTQMVYYGGADFIDKSPLALIVTYPKSKNPYHDNIQSSSACIQNMILKAVELNIGSCWICHLPSKNKVRVLLNIPYHYDIIACVVFGYPLNEPKPMKRKYNYKELFMFDENKINIKDTMKNIYLSQPIRPKIIEKKFTKRFEN